MYIYIGEIVNTHGIKGEVRILSDFDYKKQVFKKGNNIYIGKNKEKLEIASYRVHKNFDMVTFKSITDINDVLGYKGELVYINRDEIKIDGLIDQDYVGLKVVGNTELGTVSGVVKNKNQKLLVINNNDKHYYIPMVEEFINKVDLDNKTITINEIPGLIDED